VFSETSSGIGFVLYFAAKSRGGRIVSGFILKLGSFGPAGKMAIQKLASYCNFAK